MFAKLWSRHFAGLPYQWSTTFIDVAPADRIPGTQRAITQVAPDLSQSHELQVVHFPGWGATTAQLEWQYLFNLMDVLEKENVQNPAYLGINACGKGTPAWMETRDHLSEIRLDNELLDVQRIIRKLIQNGTLKGKVHLVGHSTGVLNALAAVQPLTDANIPIHGITEFAPAFGLLSPRFLLAVRAKMLSAIQALSTGEGFEPFDKEQLKGKNEYAEMMLGWKGVTDETFAHQLRGVPDSARELLDIIFHSARRLDHVLATLKTNNIPVHVVTHEKDKIVPPSMPAHHADDLRSKGIYVTFSPLPSFAHTLPFKMKKIEIQNRYPEALREILLKKLFITFRQ